MLVKELIEILQRMPPDADVFHIWDGEPRTEINCVWLSRLGDVMTSDYDEVVYSSDAFPVGAENRVGSKYWYSPKRGSK